MVLRKIVKGMGSGLLLGVLLGAMSCKGGESPQKVAIDEGRDTLRVALLACDTVKGVEQKLMARLRQRDKVVAAVVYSCYWDAYEALKGGKVDLLKTDSVGRGYVEENDSVDLKQVLPMKNEWALVVAKGSGIKSLKLLKNHTIGMNKYTNAEEVMKLVSRKTGEKLEDYPLVLVHSPKMLYDMWQAGQVDAAVLPQYYKDLAVKVGAKVLAEYKAGERESGIYAVDSVAQLFR